MGLSKFFSVGMFGHVVRLVSRDLFGFARTYYKQIRLRPRGSGCNAGSQTKSAAAAHLLTRDPRPHRTGVVTETCSEHRADCNMDEPRQVYSIQTGISQIPTFNEYPQYLA